MSKQSKPLTPALFAAEWQKLQNDHVPVYAYHLKPPHKNQILRELRELQIPGLKVLEEGQTLTI